MIIDYGKRITSHGFSNICDNRVVSGETRVAKGESTFLGAACAREPSRRLLLFHSRKLNFERLVNSWPFDAPLRSFLIYVPRGARRSQLSTLCSTIFSFKFDLVPLRFILPASCWSPEDYL